MPVSIDNITLSTTEFERNVAKPLPLLLAVGLLISGGLLTMQAWATIEQSESCRYWKSTKGTIVRSAAVERFSRIIGTWWKLELVYSYRVQGRRYVGSEYGIDAFWDRQPDKVVKAARVTFRPGAQVKVRYSPHDPRHSVLSIDRSGYHDWALGMGLTTLLAGVVYALLRGWASLRIIEVVEVERGTRRECTDLIRIEAENVDCQDGTRWSCRVNLCYLRSNELSFRVTRASTTMAEHSTPMIHCSDTVFGLEALLSTSPASEYLSELWSISRPASLIGKLTQHKCTLTSTAHLDVDGVETFADLAHSLTEHLLTKLSEHTTTSNSRH